MMQADEVEPLGPTSFPTTGPNSLARFGPRGLARLLDSLLIGVPALSGTLLAYALADADADTAAESAIAVAGVVWFVLTLAYETGFVAWRGQTLGKMALGLRVARIDNGRPPGWTHAAIRFCIPGMLLALPYGLAKVAGATIYFSSSWSPLMRGLHDRAAGTVVVRAR